MVNKVRGQVESPRRARGPSSARPALASRGFRPGICRPSRSEPRGEANAVSHAPPRPVMAAQSWDCRLGRSRSRSCSRWRPATPGR